MGLPTGGFHQLGQRRALGLLQQMNNLNFFAAVARLASGLVAALGGLLGAGGLTARLSLGHCNVGLLCRSDGLFRGPLDRFSQSLNPRPNPADRRLGAFEASPIRSPVGRVTERLAKM